MTVFDTRLVGVLCDVGSVAVLVIYAHAPKYGNSLPLFNFAVTEGARLVLGQRLLDNSINHVVDPPAKVHRAVGHHVSVDRPQVVHEVEVMTTGRFGPDERAYGAVEALHGEVLVRVVDVLWEVVRFGAHGALRVWAADEKRVLIGGPHGLEGVFFPRFDVAKHMIVEFYRVVKDDVANLAGVRVAFGHCPLSLLLILLGSSSSSASPSLFFVLFFFSCFFRLFFPPLKKKKSRRTKENYLLRSEKKMPKGKKILDFGFWIYKFNFKFK